MNWETAAARCSSVVHVAVASSWPRQLHPLSRHRTDESRRLYTNTSNMLHYTLLRLRTTFRDRTFCHAGTTARNPLPVCSYTAELHRALNMYHRVHVLARSDKYIE